MQALEVFWAPAPFNSEQEQWNIHYQEPRLVYSIFRSQKNPHFTKCPATRDHGKKLFRVDSTFTDINNFDDDFLKKVSMYKNGSYFSADGLLSFRKERETSIAGYIDIVYNMGWYFWTPESTLAKFTAPYFPSYTPADGALLAPGQFDIGRWFRPWNLDYHIPLETKQFKILENQPLFFVEFLTDKPIIFKRFILTPELSELGKEMSQQSNRLPKMSLLERYEMASKSKLMKLVEKNIRMSVVE